MTDCATHVLTAPNNLHIHNRRTIGLILCRSKSDITVEYALQDINKPIGVATYQLKEDLPEPLKDSLPSIEQLEMELQIAAAEIEEQDSEPEDKKL